MISIDLSEVRQLADSLGRSGAEASAAAHGAAKATGRAVLRKAKAEAPRDRPWLAKGGIRLKTWRDRNGTHADIFTVPDDKGRNVGFHVEHGSTTRAPVPFLSTQMTWAAPQFHDAVLSRLDPLP